MVETVMCLRKQLILYKWHVFFNPPWGCNGNNILELDPHSVFLLLYQG